MRAVILAAGQGERLRPITDDRPKCMIEFDGQTLLSQQLSVLRNSGIEDITVVTGYRPEAIEELGVNTLHNPCFARTNMVATLFVAAELFDGAADVLVAYADIIYEPRIIQVLADARGPVATVVDRNWQQLWSARMADPLSDAETLKLGADGRIVQLGQPARSLDEIQGQYVGLTKISQAFARDFAAAYHQLDPQASFDGRNKNTMYMTSFLQYLIDAGVNVWPVFVDGGWLEFDTLQDLHTYEAMRRDGRLAALFKRD